MLEIAIAIAPTRAGVWVVKRANPEGNLLWTFPSGKIDPGETPEQAALRELHEETGQKMLWADTYDRIVAGDMVKHYVLCNIDCGRDEQQTDLKIEEVRLVSVGVLEELFTTPVNPRVLNYLCGWYANSGSPP